MEEKQIIEGKVLDVIDNFKVAINKGERDGVYTGQKFLIYYLSEHDMIDEDTGENLGKIEYVIGKGKVVHLQDKIATIQSFEKNTLGKKTIKKSNNIFAITTEETIIEPEDEFVSFESCKKGFLVRSIS